MDSSDAKPSDRSNEPRTPETPVERFTPPRLSIAHLLIWTAVAAVLMKLSSVLWDNQVLNNYLENASQVERIFSLGVGAIMYMTHSAGLVGMGVILLARIRGAKGRLQPGHWLLVIYTLYYIVQALHMSRVPGLAYTYFFIRMAILVGPSLWAAFLSRGGRHWTVALCLLPAIELGKIGLMIIWSRFFSLQTLAIIPGLIYYAASGLVVLTAVSIDLYKGERRDWLHWTGAAMVAVEVLVGAGSMLLYLIVRG